MFLCVPKFSTALQFPCIPPLSNFLAFLPFPISPRHKRPPRRPKPSARVELLAGNSTNRRQHIDMKNRDPNPGTTRCATLPLLSRIPTCSRALVLQHRQPYGCPVAALALRRTSDAVAACRRSAGYITAASPHRTRRLHWTPRR
jgi:hypothetical protein